MSLSFQKSMGLCSARLQGAGYDREPKWVADLRRIGVDKYPDIWLDGCLSRWTY